MFDRFTDLARLVVSQAVRAAEHRGSTAIEPEHLLFAILELDHGVAITALSNAGFGVFGAVRQLMDWMPQSATPSKDLEPSASLREVLAAADRVSTEMGHTYVGTEHLLVALLSVSPAGSVSNLLLRQHLGLDPAQIRADIESMLADPAPDTLLALRPPPPPIDGALPVWNPTTKPEQYVLLGDRGTETDGLIIAEDQPDAERLLDVLATAARKAGYTRIRAVPIWAWIHITQPAVTDLLKQVRELSAQALVRDLHPPSKTSRPARVKRGRSPRAAKLKRPAP